MFLIMAYDKLNVPYGLKQNFQISYFFKACIKQVNDASHERST